MVHGPFFHESFILAEVKKGPKKSTSQQSCLIVNKNNGRVQLGIAWGKEAGDASQNRGRKASMHSAVSGEAAQV